MRGRGKKKKGKVTQSARYVPSNDINAAKKHTISRKQKPVTCDW